jgi:predicted MFS family arabinose efflux permease
MTARQRKVFILVLALSLMMLAFGIGVEVGAWISGHRPEAWTLALPVVTMLFALGLLSIFVWNQDAPRA